MELITSSICPKRDLIDTLQQMVHEKFNPSLKNQFGIASSLHHYFDDFRDDLYCYMEYPYVDRMYRDSYYNYFSSKHLVYDRNCIRLSFFSDEITEDDFRNNSRNPGLQDKFLGYFVIRPTRNALVGRSMVSPLALKNHVMLVCLVSEQCSINGVKLTVSAFPHSSQDAETITCAETTIWSVMEYFGKKYSYYKPVLPSEIIGVLDRQSPERLKPSQGLKLSQISYAVKEFGFGSKVYFKDAYNHSEFQGILSYYMESGIPVIVTLANSIGIGHAVVYCGHESVDVVVGDFNQYSEIERENGMPLKVYDSAYLPKKYVSIDDNFRPYQTVSFENPVSYYQSGSEIEGCEVIGFVVPLYPKIYLEAYQARKLVDIIISSPDIGIDKDEVVVRFFLTSSRSFKNCVNSDANFDEDLKNVIVGISMPKFVWIAELTSRELFCQGKVDGFIILDATGSKTTESIVFIAYSDRFIFIDQGVFNVVKRMNHNVYTMYKNNLKGRWNRWQS